MKIRILYLEDSPEDVELVERVLSEGGYECETTIVDSEAGFKAGLADPGLDLILSDRSLPGYDGIVALATALHTRPDVPYIFVSGTLGEELAIECVKGGATDYVLKDRLARLLPVVTRALEESRHRRDVEEIKNELEATQQAFYQSQKMESIGHLTGGIAHDFNNLLAVVLGYAEVVQRRTEEDDVRYQFLGEIITASRRAAGLVEQLLSYSRNQRVAPENIQLNDELGAIAKMLQRLVGDRIAVEISVAEELWPVEIDRVRFDQVMFNLVANARDAITGSGRIAISTENQHIESNRIAEATELPPGDYAVVHVTDTGSGMDAKLLESIFEPFFTTKEAGKGTGLGLASSLGIIRQSGGSITVSSEPGKGTRFDIYLPRSDRPTASHPSRTVTRARGKSKGNTTVLIVDDDLSVLSLIELVASNAGYFVVAADTGKAALERAESREDEIDLLLTDVVLPDCSGIELAERLRALFPDIKVAYTSGYGNSVIEELGLTHVSAPILPKPFSVDELLECLNSSLRRQ